LQNREWRGNVQLSHGNGGRLTHELIEHLFMPRFGNVFLETMLDSTLIIVDQGRLAVSTDGFVVQPYFFPGGNIGDLAINGTVNDLLMSGATPLFLTVSFILEEGLPFEHLITIVESMADAAKSAQIQLIAGDTKVVEHGSADGLFITTTGIGSVPHEVQWHPQSVKPGDQIIVSGTIGDHGASVLASRYEMDFDHTIQSDTCHLRDLVLSVRDLPGIRCMRDPTRGGLATTLYELAQASQLNYRIHERKLPIHESVRGLCEVLGLDPLYVANEGKLVTVVAPEDADTALLRFRQFATGKNAMIIGEITDEFKGWPTLVTPIGASRILDLLSVDQLPRIC
jgi:hydrogenase expression/formation protein HypE